MTPRCTQCGYCLDGLPESRCPECGSPFVPGKPCRPVRRKLGVVSSTLALIAVAYFVGSAVHWALGYAHAAAVVDIVHCGHAIIRHNSHIANASLALLVPALAWPVAIYARYGTPLARMSLLVGLIVFLLCFIVPACS